MSFLFRNLFEMIFILNCKADDIKAEENPHRTEMLTGFMNISDNVVNIVVTMSEN